MKKEDKIFMESYEAIDAIFKTLTSEGGAIDQHKEKYGAADTYKLVHEMERIYVGIRDLLRSSNRDEFKQIGLAMYGLQHNIIGAERKLSVESGKFDITMEDLEALCEECKAS